MSYTARYYPNVTINKSITKNCENIELDINNRTNNVFDSLIKLTRRPEMLEPRKCISERKIRKMIQMRK